MVNGKVLAYLCPRVYVDTRLAVSLLGDDTRYYRHLQLVQLVSYAIVRHRVHRWVAEYHLAKVGRSRVVVKHRLYVSIQQSLYLGQSIDKLQRLLLGYAVYLRLGAVSLAVLAELQSVSYLLSQQRGQFLHRHTYMVCAYSLVGLSLLKIVGEDDVLNQRHYALHHLNRWQRSHRGRHHAHLLLSLLRQQRHIPAQRLVYLCLVHTFFRYLPAKV